MKVKEKRGRLTFLNVLMLIALIFYTVSLISVFSWAFLQSFRDSYDYTQNGPLNFKLQNATLKYWKLVFTEFQYKDVYIEGMLLWSVLYAVGASFTQVLSITLLAYAVGRFNYKSNVIITSVLLIAMILPVVGSLPSEITMMETLRLRDKVWGLWILKAHPISIYFFVLAESFRAIPKDFADSASLDGASGPRIMVSIMLPMVKNVLGTVFLILFVTYWNDYQTPLVYMSEKPTLVYGFFKIMWIDAYINEETGEYVDFNFLPGQIATCMVVVLPIIVLFASFQNKFMGNISMGGLKE